MKTTRIIALTLIVLLALSVLNSCSTSNAPKDTAVKTDVIVPHEVVVLAEIEEEYIGNFEGFETYRSGTNLYFWDKEEKCYVTDKLASIIGVTSTTDGGAQLILLLSTGELVVTFFNSPTLNSYYLPLEEVIELTEGEFWLKYAKNW